MNSNFVHRICLVAIAGVLASAELALAVSPEDRPGSDETRTTLELRRKEFVEAVSRADAAGVANLFTTDAKLILAGFDPFQGHALIQQAWQFAFASGAVARVAFEPRDLDGLGGELLVETGTLEMFDKEGKGRTQDNYLLVWKHEDGLWKIYRDIANTRFAAAPTADRVGFPRDYRSRLAMLAPPTLNPKLGMVQTAYGNEPASSAVASANLPFAYGSVLVMEFATVVKDGGGNPMLEPDGNPQRGPINRVDVMRRERGFGEAYGKNRAGEWEFVSYRVDGSHSVPPSGSASCAECHLNKAGAANDFVFPLARFSKTEMGAPSLK